MIVSSLKKKNSSVELYFEDGNSIVVDYGVVVSNGIRKNDDLSQDKIEYLLNRSELKKIQNYAFRFLGIRNHSSLEIKLKLFKKKFPHDLVNEAVNDLLDRNILNDQQFAQQYLEEKTTKGKSGPGKIKSELIRKGISREILEELFAKADNTQTIETALKLAIKKQKSIKEKDFKKSKQKIFSFLHNKGFDSDIIANVLNKLKLDDE
ncbi:MAG: regulatory protein RecX [Ignavibacteria bacterium]|nr:regulatory protein RecX [Ignavibacteria bacterium]